jgi:hypothetical protein
MSTKKVMDQLAAVYPELGKTHPKIPKGIEPDGTITRDAKPYVVKPLTDDVSK